MKLQILSGALGLVLLMSLVPLPNAEAKMIVIDDTEAEVVREIFHLFLNGKSSISSQYT